MAGGQRCKGFRGPELSHSEAHCSPSPSCCSNNYPGTPSSAGRWKQHLWPSRRQEAQAGGRHYRAPYTACMWWTNGREGEAKRFVCCGEKRRRLNSGEERAKDGIHCQLGPRDVCAASRSVTLPQLGAMLMYVLPPKPYRCLRSGPPPETMTISGGHAAIPIRVTCTATQRHGDIWT